MLFKPTPQYLADEDANLSRTNRYEALSVASTSLDNGHTSVVRIISQKRKTIYAGRKILNHFKRPVLRLGSCISTESLRAGHYPVGRAESFS